MEKTIEQIAEENERRIVKFKNVDKESFTHAFRGIKITVKAGEEYIGRYPECDHLATHLARKMIAREKKAKGMANDPRGSVLYKEEEVNELKAQILSDLGMETRDVLTPEQQREEDLKQIDRKFSNKTSVPDVTKADVIKSLKERGVEPDVNKTKEELLSQLIEVEQQA